MNEWQDYEIVRPEKIGIYEWRIPSVAVPGVVIITTAWMRSSGAGLRNIISPMFDYWNGYKVSVPAGLQWREAPCELTLSEYNHGPQKVNAGEK